MAEDVQFRQSKGNNSAITDVTSMNLHVHNLTMAHVFNICFIKFHPLVT